MWKINQLNIDLYLQCKGYWLAVVVAELVVVGDVAANCVVVVDDGVVVVVCCFVVDGWVVDDGSIVVGCFVVTDSIVFVVNAGVVVIGCIVIDEVVGCFVVDDGLIVVNSCAVVDDNGDVVVVKCIFAVVFVVELMVVVSGVVEVLGDNDISPEDVDFVVDIVIGRSQIFGSIWRMSWTVPENSSRAAILWSFVQFTPKSTRIFSNTQSTADKIYLKKRKKNFLSWNFNSFVRWHKWPKNSSFYLVTLPRPNLTHLKTVNSYSYLLAFDVVWWIRHFA